MITKRNLYAFPTFTLIFEFLRNLNPVHVEMGLVARV
jgi:hypothetical protein